VTVLLETRALCAGYHGSAVVRDLDLTVSAGEVVALLGPNGAGKTTTLLTLAGDLPPVSGEVLLDGSVTKAPLHRRAAGGLGLVPEERSVFMGLTAGENLRVGGVDIDRVLALFPELKSKLGTRAGLLSGGEQQMLTLGRALGRDPRILLADELSLGLAPLVVDRLLAAVRESADSGVAVVLVEQHVSKVLTVADRVYLLRRGQVELSCTAAEAGRRLSEIAQSYLGQVPKGSPAT
jgi:ABC-type branched-subunit amino acid transport system ATPase component